MIAPFYRHSRPLLYSKYFKEIKDPAIVFDTHQWHIYATGIVPDDQSWQGETFHATAKTIIGPWHEHKPVIVPVRGSCVAAPEVVFEKGVFHMFLQTTCFELGGAIDHLFSYDGEHFEQYSKVLNAIPDSQEAGIYDQSPDIIKGQKYLTYAAMAKVGETDIYLAKSVDGSWTHFQRLGSILSHDEVDCHNKIGESDYEWGLEGPQLLELPSGGVLLIAVCFLPNKPRGEKQRIIFAKGDNVKGPYNCLGIALEPTAESWDNAENGHATGVIQDDTLHLFYQGRGKEGLWNIGYAKYSVNDIMEE
jgi:hypothetical protein